MITLRLDKELEKSVENTAKAVGVSKSELVRLSIKDYLNRLNQSQAWELGKEVFGKYQSENTNLARDSEKILREKFRASGNNE